MRLARMIRPTRARGLLARRVLGRSPVPQVGGLLIRCSSHMDANVGTAPCESQERKPHARLRTRKTTIMEESKGARKPKLTVGEQIDHLKSKGVTFDLCDEQTAARILSERDHYFRLATYRVLFPKRVGGERDGQYAGLDFGHLVDLAEIDQELRGFLLPLTLVVENAAKTKLVGKITENREEDGYSIFADYLEHLNHADRNRRKGEITRLGNDAYLGPLAARYPIDEMPAWVFLELSSFGAFADFYLFCAERWGDSSMRREHYLLRCSNSLRNAAAHSSAIINGFASSAPESPIRTPSEVASALEAAGINKRSRRAKMRNIRIQQIVVLGFSYSHFTNKQGRKHTTSRLSLLKCRASRHSHWYEKNTVLTSSFEFIDRALRGMLEP